ncbi:Pentatricopeptide repeat [Thalictrum thalictroides]|uniref:Pentatricopeptide repeat n=1 Tax=Thalictrum thalictroides TaxID=46969 RepID=A0A7J6WYN6_THATH|nr:Pentatricopeptide repeat [Thalictrum thalictroides]
MSSQLSRSFFTSLSHFTEQKNLKKGRALHAQIFKTGLHSDLYLANTLVNLYAKCNLLSEAKFQFEEIQHKDVVSWNCIINGFSQKGVKGGSLFVMKFFQRMRAEDSVPNPFTFAGVFTAASSVCDVFGGKQAHTVAIKLGSCSDVFVGSSLLNMYCKSGLVCDGRKVFDEMPERNSVSWATMISGYAGDRRGDDAVELFKLMRREENEENEFVFTSVLSSLVVYEFVDVSRQIHGLAAKNGLLSFVAVGNALVTMYAKCGSLEDAHKTFELLSEKTLLLGLQ